MNLLTAGDPSRTYARQVFSDEAGDEPTVKLTRVLLTGLLMLPALVKAQESAPPQSSFRAPGLAPGDQIDVRMFDFPDLGSGALRLHVSADGSVHLPYAGTVQAVGESPDEFQRSVTEALKSKGIVKEPNVSVEVVSAVNLLVLVLGEVRTPKSIPLYAPAPIRFILGEVGGTTGLASAHLTILHHSDQPPTSIDYDPDVPTSAAMQTMVQPGDIIHVSPLGVYFVAGEVNRPGIYPLGGALSIGQAGPTSGMGVVKNITLLQALAQAGGITPIAARSKMRILRTVDGKREEIIVDQVKLYKGEVADPILHADDIIYVPTSYLRQQTNNLFATAISGVYAAAQLKALNQ
jgi:polysaccharide export outer membrane protein